MNIKELNEAIEIAMKEDYSELKNDKSLDVYRKILNDNEKIDDYIFQDKKHVLIKFHNVTPKDRKQVIILDDKFEERLNKAYDKCRKVNESLKPSKTGEKAMKESKDETIYVLRHPDYHDVPDIACKSQTLIKYAEERRQDYLKTDDTITKNTITNVFAAKSFLEDNGFIIQEYVLY